MDLVFQKNFHFAANLCINFASEDNFRLLKGFLCSSSNQQAYACYNYREDLMLVRLWHQSLRSFL